MINKSISLRMRRPRSGLSNCSFKTPLFRAADRGVRVRLLLDDHRNSQLYQVLESRDLLISGMVTAQVSKALVINETRLKSVAGAIGATLDMRIANVQAQRVPIQQTAAEVPDPAPRLMTKAYAPICDADYLCQSANLNTRFPKEAAPLPYDDEK